MITKKTETKEAKETKGNSWEKWDYEVKVTRVHEVKEHTYAFDMVCNGISIYGCYLNQGTKMDGSEYSVINFPAQKGKDGKFYNFCWFPISKELQKDIENQIGGLL